MNNKEMTHNELKEMIKKCRTDLYCGRIPDNIESIVDNYCCIFEDKFDFKRFLLSEQEIWNFIQEVECNVYPEYI